MKKTILTFTILPVAIISIATAITMSKMSGYRPYHTREELINYNNFDSKRDNATYESALILDKPKNIKVEGSYDNSFNISKIELQRIFKNFSMELTNLGKELTAQEMHTILQNEISTKQLGAGRYFDEGKISFEEIMKQPQIAQYFNITWPDFKEYNQKFYEIRYTLEQYNPKTPNVITIRAQFYHSDKLHIDYIQPTIVMKHDTGVAIGPMWFLTISGFKA
ncbi:Uncharacterised protein [Metamycoplasma cloacale]|uniref:Uncharacterized protein n=1 Tax=Metamycoplasma cloacale TaxID=92401 RepID=A0A2Z4LLG4_9BACT|nr:hypothetical protein [Metamycoplasma cloacale]AWX42602.1 hypothetical protein DK849_00685 [Metamycoplasma cloacale]VEU79660.1 Uncharacterised protein [Metamycoplasma cloacale]